MRESLVLDGFVRSFIRALKDKRALMLPTTSSASERQRHTLIQITMVCIVCVYNTQLVLAGWLVGYTFFSLLFWPSRFAFIEE